jgi:hypothetical protein
MRQPNGLHCSGEKRLAPYGRLAQTLYSRHNVEKIALLDFQVRVRAAGGGTIELVSRGGEPTEWIEVEPYVFRQAQGDQMLAFGPGGTAGITHMYRKLNGVVPGALEKLPWYEQDRFVVGFLFGFLTLFGATFAGWPTTAVVAAIVRRRRKRPAPTSPIGWRSGLLAWIYALSALIFLAGIDVSLGNSDYQMELIYGMSREVVLLLWIPIVAAILTVPLVLECVAVWRQGRGSLAGRCGYSLFTLAACAFVGFTAQWNLLGFQY